MLYDRWREIAAQRANQLALIDVETGRHWTFAELADAAETPAGSPEKIAFPGGNSTDFVLEVLRGWRCAAVLCPVERGDKIEYADSQAFLASILSRSTTEPEPSPHVDAAPSPPAQEREGDRRPEKEACALNLVWPAGSQINQLDLPPHIVHLKFTSATGGVPRLIAFTASQLAADAQNIVNTMGLRADCPNLGVISLAHSYGFSNLVLPLLLHGIPLVLSGGALPEQVRGAAGLMPAVTLAAVPALWQSWHDAGAIPENVRLAISAGAPLPLTLEQSVFDRHNLKIHNFYGSSECGGIAYDDSPEPRSDPAYVGRFLQGVEVVTGEEGCLAVRSEAVGQTYWPKPSSALGQGIFRTSDLGEVIGDKVYLRGRAGDLINVAGRKVAPEAIEQVLATHPQVRGCLAFGVPSPDPQRGEIIVACVVAEGELANQSLKQLALDKLPAWQVPREWWLVDSLEVNGRGKLSRSAWRRKYLEEKHKKTEGFTPR